MLSRFSNQIQIKAEIVNTGNIHAHQFIRSNQMPHVVLYEQDNLQVVHYSMQKIQNDFCYCIVHRAGQKASGDLLAAQTKIKKLLGSLYNEKCKEEIGKLPTIIKVMPLETFISNDQFFNFHTYLCIINEEFIPKLNIEHDGYCWGYFKSVA